MFKYFDAHSHLNLDPLKKNVGEIIAVLEKENIGTITIGVDFETSKEAVSLSEKSNNLFAGVGLHPNDVTTSFVLSEVEWAAYKKLAKHPRVVCIGECGLDYYRLTPQKNKETEEQKNIQKEVFKKQIDLALELDLPLMLHVRPSAKTMDAYEDAIEILNSYFLIHNSKLRGNSHFFVGNLKIAKKFLGLGFTLSFPGVITFARDYDEVVRYAPLDMILSETDAPFACPELFIPSGVEGSREAAAEYIEAGVPVPGRGKTCYPQYVKEVVKKIAEIKNSGYDTVRDMLVKNALRVFNITTNNE